MKGKKLLSVLLTLAVILTVCAVTAFAADGEIDAADFGTAGLNKTLNVADGITGYPNDFTFSFTAQGSTTTTAAESPVIDTVHVTVGTQSDDVATGITHYADIFDIADFPHAGEYIYEVRETTAASTTTADGITKTLTVDETVYLVHVYVINSGTGLAFSTITVDKADPDNAENRIKTDLAFENTYTEIITNPLTIVKSITGDYGDKTKTFPVTMTLTLPATATAADVEVTDGEGNALTVTGTAPTLTVTANLADGDSIVFTKLPAGTTFVVAEDQDSAYTSKTTGFVAVPDTEYQTGDVEKAGSGPIVAAGNNVGIENHREDLVPTGVVIENLPYVLLFVIAVAGVVYLQLKKKARA